MTVFGQILITIIVLCGMWHVVSTVLIAIELEKRKVKINPILIGVMTMANLSRYREITLSGTGRVGFLYYSYIVSINIALAIALIAFTSGVFN